MAAFEITSFLQLASLMLAARKLVADPDPFNKGEALVALAQDGGALKRLMGERGLTPLARKMACAAEEAEAMTHPGYAIDDAKAIFWQVAPEAFADPAIFAGANLDPAAITNAMVARIKASPHRRDFEERELNQAYFCRVCHLTLGRMLADAAFVDSITPDLWRESLTRQGVQLEQTREIKHDTSEILSLVRELHAVKQTTVPEDTLIAMARKIHPRISNREEALRELDRAADLAADAIARGEQGSNVDAFVDGVLRRVAELTREGRLDEAAQDSDDAVDQAEAGFIQLLDASISQHRLASDAKGAARQIERKVRIEIGDHSKLFDALRDEQDVWYVSGRDKGARLDLEISIALAERSLASAQSPHQRATALNVLGATLQTLGERESGTTRLEQAIAAYCGALKERPRERVPLDWAMTQNNFGTALAMLGERKSGTARLEEAVTAFRAALEEQTQARVPLDWATTQNNLGNALLTLGERESGTARLEEAVAAYRAALKERTRERVPLDWAMTQNNLGNALWTIGERERGTARLEEAVAAYCAALKERTRERVPLKWANTTGNQGSALRDLAERTHDLPMAQQALSQLREAAEVLRAGEHIPRAETFERQIPEAIELVEKLVGRAT